MEEGARVSVGRAYSERQLRGGGGSWQGGL